MHWLFKEWDSEDRQRIWHLWDWHCNAVIAATFGLSSSATADFTFPVTDSNGTTSYRCHMKETLAETEENARAAHAFFEPRLLDTARNQADAMAATMLPGRPSSEIAAELDLIYAESDSNRKAVHREFQQQFGCEYRGST